LVNAFDLVRLHKYGELDDEAKPDTPVNKLPSFTQMAAFALNDAGVAAIMSQERYEQAMQDFGQTASDVPATEMMIIGDKSCSSTPTQEHTLKLQIIF
jgi:putative DNA primase/helicase